ncbi:MAG: endolytic transglycosylase MltG [Myxococcota bacterium]
MRRLLLGLALLVLLTLGGSLATWSWIQAEFARPHRPEAEEQILKVPVGTTETRLGRLLEEEDLISSAEIYRVLLALEPDGPKPKAGRHRVSAGQSMRTLRGILGEPPLPEDEAFTLLEGWRLKDTDAALTQEGLIKPGDYLSAAGRVGDYELPFTVEGRALEGYLLPETYRFPRDRFRVEDLVQRQLDAFVERFHTPNAKAIAESGRSLHDIVTVASMVEREEPSSANRPLVAGIIYKRLDRKIPLGIDATSRYPLARWNDERTFRRELKDKNKPYNTRHRPGLPPTPIGAPSVDALRAALRPQDSPYLFYLHDANQQIHFAKTAKGHERNRRRYNVW